MITGLFNQRPHWRDEPRRDEEKIFTVTVPVKVTCEVGDVECSYSLVLWSDVSLKLEASRKENSCQVCAKQRARSGRAGGGGFSLGVRTGLGEPKSAFGFK